MTGNELVIHVDYSAPGIGSGDWNCIVCDPRTSEPFTPLPNRTMEDAVFAYASLRDMEPLRQLHETREIRREMVHRHFKECARRLIAQIEAKEKWDELSRFTGELLG